MHLKYDENYHQIKIINRNFKHEMFPQFHAILLSNKFLQISHKFVQNISNFKRSFYYGLMRECIKRCLRNLFIFFFVFMQKNNTNVVIEKI